MRQGGFQGNWSVLEIKSVGRRGVHGFAGFGASITDTFTDTGRYAKYLLQGLGFVNCREEGLKLLLCFNGKSESLVLGILVTPGIDWYDGSKVIAQRFFSFR